MKTGHRDYSVQCIGVRAMASLSTVKYSCTPVCSMCTMCLDLSSSIISHSLIRFYFYKIHSRIVLQLDIYSVHKNLIWDLEPVSGQWSSRDGSRALGRSLTCPI